MGEEHSANNLYDVIVVGAGIIGSSTAYQAAKRGFKVLLLEQFDFLHHRGSSHGESRTIRATYPQSYYCDMVRESSILWEQAEAEIGYKVYFKTAHLDIGRPDDKDLISLVHSCSVNGYPFDKIDPVQVRDRFEGRITIPDDWIAVTTGIGGVLKATKAVSIFQILAARNGAVLKDNTKVVTVGKEEKGVSVVTANGEKFRGRKCVVTAGGWAGKLVKRIAGIALPIEPLETVVHYWRIKEGYENKFTMESGFPTFSSYGSPYFYGTPSFEYPGLIKVGIHGGKACDPDTRRWENSEELHKPIRDWIKVTFGGMVEDGVPAMSQLCMYSVTPDDDYVIDFVGGEFGIDVVVGAGFSGHGFKMGPIVGRMLADMVLTGIPDDVALRHFSIRRFQKTLSEQEG